ncbi:MAG: tetratricopeptide repeat protein [Nitrospirota bacterium]
MNPGLMLSTLREIELAVIIVMILTYGWATHQRNLVWKDDISLWSDVVKKSPAKARVHNYLGLAYHKIGDMDNAILQHKKSLSLNPFYADAHNNIGIFYFDKGLVDKAITHFKHAIEINPAHADAHYNLGVAYGEKGLNELAYEEMRKGIELRKR